MGEPRFAFEFGLELAGAPTGVAREQPDLLRLREGATDVDQLFEGVAETEVRHHVRVRQKDVGVQIAEGAGLNRAAQINIEILDRVGEIGDEDIADFVWAGLIEDEAERALFVVLANKND